MLCTRFGGRVACFYFSRAFALVRDRTHKRRGGFLSSWACAVCRNALPDISGMPLRVHLGVLFPTQTLSFILLLSLSQPFPENNVVYHKPGARVRLERPNVGTLGVILFSSLSSKRSEGQCGGGERVSRVLAPVWLCLGKQRLVWLAQQQTALIVPLRVGY